MSSFSLRPAAAADTAAVAEVQIALETKLYGGTTYSPSDVEEEWSDLDLERDAIVVLEGERVVGFGTMRERGELWRVDGSIHPDVHGRGAGTKLAAAMEAVAARSGGRRVQNSVLEADTTAQALVESLGYRRARAFYELRIELDTAPAPPAWPDGLRADSFDPERDDRAFHAAQQEAFADHWRHTPRAFEDWRKNNIENEKFDASLWCVVRDGDEIAAGTINIADLYGGGWVASLFTRRPWRRRGVGGALLADAFGRFWERGERSVGLGVDAEGDTGALQVYERAGMKPALGWLAYEKELDAGAA
jgi:ribosomal protein S18 acetylase RimI-like enzyme